MSSPEETQDVERFRTWIERRLGLQFAGDKVEFLRDVLRGRAAARGLASTTSYLGWLATRIDTLAESRALAEALTVNETYFFRNPDHFRAFTEVVVPRCRRDHGEHPRLRILSAGCASGEEAYSMAIALRHHIPDIGRWDVSIRAVDVNPQVIEKAIRGRYSAWSLRETTAEIRDHYFRTEGSEYVIDAKIRAMVSFEERNLVEDDPSLLRAGAFDVIFCRNMIMYLVPIVASSLVERLTGALTPGGFLFLGHAETLRGISTAFHLCHTHDTFYYQRRSEAEVSQRCVPVRSFTGDSSRPLPATAFDVNTSWFDVITASARRVASLSLTPPAARSTARSLGEHGNSAPIPLSSRRTAGLGRALELLREEMFVEALEVVRALPADSAADPDTQLFCALLLTNCGGVAEAEQICREVLARDELNAGAHYLLALCLEHAGDLAGAVEHDQDAVYLDPAFAMPRLHLGLLARRQGDRTAARRELQQALVLLTGEDPSRVLFFGGGFNRESLVALCDSELRACEEAA